MKDLGKGSFAPIWAGLAGRLTEKLLPGLLAAVRGLHLAAKIGLSMEVVAAEEVRLTDALLG